MPSRRRFSTPVGFGAAALITCALLTDVGGEPIIEQDRLARRAPVDQAAPTLTLAFAGDIHFEGTFAGEPADDDSTLGPLSETLRAADLSMVNLESAVTTRGRPADKELEDANNRYWFRTEPEALDVLDRSGIDVVSVANNHGADFGLTGIRDTIAAGEASDVAVVGVGRDDRAAFAPHRSTVRGLDVAVHAADASPRESADPLWAAEPGTGPGLAAARGADTEALEQAVRRSAATDDVVVVYLHWGEELDPCPTPRQQVTSDRLRAAGADVVVGTHAHVPLGSGMKGSTYVNYGLGNFYWYHGRQADSGVLNLTLEGDEVVGDEWVPARIPEGGGAARPLEGRAAASAVQDWQDLRGCTDLDPGPGPVDLPDADDEPADPPEDELPAFASTIEAIGPSVRRTMRSHTTACPVALADLRHVELTYVGFDGRAHRGELVVNEDVADDVVDVFAALYEERFPIEQMLLIDEFEGDDDRSMAANNTSAYNCRRVAGQPTWSDHAYGRAIDINPVQNPYLVGDDVRPPAAEPFVSVDRDEDAEARPGVIRDGDVVRDAFERIGWEWGGLYPDPDYQHFSAPQ